jgi:hypothetical protein
LLSLADALGRNLQIKKREKADKVKEKGRKFKMKWKTKDKIYMQKGGNNGK